MNTDCPFEPNVIDAVDERCVDSSRCARTSRRARSCAAAAEVAPWMGAFAGINEREHILPDPAVLWLKARLLQSNAAVERASLPITRLQIAAYLIIAACWAALLTWKSAALQALDQPLLPHPRNPRRHRRGRNRVTLADGPLRGDRAVVRDGGCGDAHDPSGGVRRRSQRRSRRLADPISCRSRRLRFRSRMVPDAARPIRVEIFHESHAAASHEIQPKTIAAFQPPTRCRGWRSRSSRRGLSSTG